MSGTWYYEDGRTADDLVIPFPQRSRTLTPGEYEALVEGLCLLLTLLTGGSSDACTL